MVEWRVEEELGKVDVGRRGGDVCKRPSQALVKSDEPVFQNCCLRQTRDFERTSVLASLSIGKETTCCCRR